MSDFVSLMHRGRESSLRAIGSQMQRRGMLQLLCCGMLACGLAVLGSSGFANDRNSNNGPQQAANQLLGGKYNVQIWRKLGTIQLYNGNGGTMQVTCVDGQGGLKQLTMNGHAWANLGHPPLPVSIKAVRGVGH